MMRLTCASTALALAALAPLSSVRALHEHMDDGLPPASIANQEAPKAGKESYVQMHMAHEHHIGAFDLSSFFALHDLDRNGVLDRPEIEAIYGVHHSTSVKHSRDYEVHDEKANHIVHEVLRRLDKDRNGLITQREFVNGGPDGLPSFPEYGKGVLGHHYDEESEYFVHHEEIYHNKPETQTEESYNHPEDIEHFAHHDKIEAEEENRERKAEGMPSIEEDKRLRQEAKEKGIKYESPYEAQLPKEDSPAAPQQAYDSHVADGYAEQQARVGTEHVFRTPDGPHVVKTNPDNAREAEKAALEHEQVPEKLPGETEEGYKDRLAAHQQRVVAAQDYAKANPKLANPAMKAQQGKDGDLRQAEGESAEDYARRLSRAKFAQTKAKPGYKGGAIDDKARKTAPYKYPALSQGRIKKSSYFGEF